MAPPEAQDNRKPSKVTFMRIAHFLIFLTALTGFNAVNGQDKSNDTTARYFIIQASIGNLQEIIMLKNTPAKDFDRVYVHMMVPDHAQTVQLFEKYALTGKDPDVNAFAKQMLPILKDHLASITAIDRSFQHR
jgi:uncharacterized protein (DUF305 family)